MARASIIDNVMNIVRRRRMLALLLVGVVLSTVAPDAAHAVASKAFATPEEALEALGTAASADDDTLLTALFGDARIDQIVQRDRAAAMADRSRFAAAYREFHALRDDGSDRRAVIIGFDAWPFPIPIIKGPDGWYFSADEGLREITNRRIGHNELNAIQVLRAYVDAQRSYASKDRLGDGVVQYARRIMSTQGRRDGLYWETTAPDDDSPLGPLMAEAAPYLQGHEPGDAYLGYHFRILTAQGPHAPGDAYDYIVNGHMVAGFAMVAYPARYGESGLMTFIVNQNGKVYERDLGKGTVPVAARIRTYDPTPGWREVVE